MTGNNNIEYFFVIKTICLKIFSYLCRGIHDKNTLSYDYEKDIIIFNS